MRSFLSNLSSVFSLLSLLGFYPRPVTADIPYYSYDTLFFAPNQVLNNSWFSQSKWAQETVVAWADQLQASGPWCA